ncbi:uncharacterized protein LOC142064310 [Phalacrocorax aristotelis]|uniref:uncharacterized protein LOC142064310 n=1 Tax=Phalacrocorax aristotelis TaxID=126867 RepID=UPI003F4C10B6
MGQSVRVPLAASVTAGAAPRSSGFRWRGAAERRWEGCVGRPGREVSLCGAGAPLRPGVGIPWPAETARTCAGSAAAVRPQAAIPCGGRQPLGTPGGLAAPDPRLRQPPGRAAQPWPGAGERWWVQTDESCRATEESPGERCKKVTALRCCSACEVMPPYSLLLPETVLRTWLSVLPPGMPLTAAVSGLRGFSLPGFAILAAPGQKGTHRALPGCGQELPRLKLETPTKGGGRPRVWSCRRGREERRGKKHLNG